MANVAQIVGGTGSKTQTYIRIKAQFIGADEVCVLESVRPTVRTPLAKNRTLVEKNGQKGLFFKGFDKIEGVRIEITTRYAKPGNKVSRNVFCVR